MNFLERAGIVQSSHDDVEVPVRKGKATVEPIAPALVANAEELTSIASIYEKAGLADTSKSILKVEELKAALPTNMPLEALKASVKGVMKATQLDEVDAMQDAQSRTSALTDALSTIELDADSKVGNAEEKIKDLETQIESLKEEIMSAKKFKEDQGVAINAELKRIGEIVTFLS